MKWYVLTDLGHDGIMIEEFDKKKDAEERYRQETAQETATEHREYNNGVALIHGEVTKRDRWEQW